MQVADAIALTLSYGELIDLLEPIAIAKSELTEREKATTAPFVDGLEVSHDRTILSARLTWGYRGDPDSDLIPITQEDLDSIQQTG